MDVKTAPKRRRRGRRRSRPPATGPSPQGPRGRLRRQLHGRGHPRPDVRAPLDAPGRPPVRRDRRGRSAPPTSPTRPARPSSSRRTSRSRRSGASSRPTSSSASTSAATSARPEREHSVKQLIDRVVNTIAALGGDPALLRDGRGPRRLPGRADAPPRPPEDGVQLAGLVQRRRSKPKPQCSACFINSVQDNMGSIMDLAKTEAMLFKYGSGAGVEPVAPSAARKERMSGGGIAVGPGQLHEAATTRSRASSSRAARPAARPRW